MKIGRNDPCPCGSGKKYKHCCLSNPGSAANTDNVISFPVSDNRDGGVVFGSEPFPAGLGMAQMMGFADDTEYQKALETYEFYCENILPEDRTPPTFRQFVSGDFGSSNVFEEMGLYEIARNAATKEELEARLTELLENQFIDGALIDELLADLYRKGAHTKNKAVSIDRSFPVEFLKGVPAMVLITNLLTAIASAGTTVEADQLMDFTGDFSKDLITNNLQTLGLQGQYYFEDRTPGIIVLTDLSILCAGELGFLKEVEGRVKLSEAGIEFLRGKYLKRSYLKMAKFLERDFNWFYPRFEADGNLELWQWCTAVFPLALMTFHHLGEDDGMVDPRILADRTAELVPLPSDVDPAIAAETFNDIFLAGYCAFLGYAEPCFPDEEDPVAKIRSQMSSGSEPDTELIREILTPEGWLPGDLLYDIFDWKV